MLTMLFAISSGATSRLWRLRRAGWERGGRLPSIRLADALLE